VTPFVSALGNDKRQFNLRVSTDSLDIGCVTLVALYLTKMGCNGTPWLRYENVISSDQSYGTWNIYRFL